MKKKERVHLKDDPFVDLVENAIQFFKRFRREILWGGGALLGVLVLVLALLLIRSSSWDKENRLLTQALEVRNDTGLTVDEKIERLKVLNAQRGIAAVTPLFVAQLYYEKGEFTHAHEALNKFSDSWIPLINDQKRMLEAEILSALGKDKEAQDILNLLLSAAETQLSKDYVLLNLAKMQMKSGHNSEARNSLRRIIGEFPNSLFAQDAQTFLETLEGG